MNDSSPSTPPILPRIVAAIAALGVHFVTLLLAMVVLISIVPRYTAFFEQRDVGLPGITWELIRLSDFTVNYSYLVILLGMTVDILIVVVLAFVFSKRGWLLSVYSHLWLLAVILFLSWSCIGLCIPISSLIDESDAATVSRAAT